MAGGIGHEQIIVVDDDSAVRDSIAEYLAKYGYGVRVAADGKELDQLLAQAPADLIILDVMMPGEDGLAICQRLSARTVHILIVSALSSTTDRIIGLEVGADDYLVKPFEPRELVARVRTILRRNCIGLSSDQPLFLFGGWRYDTAQPALFRPGGGEVTLTQNEHALLRAFVGCAGRLLSREQILDLARGPSAEPFDRAVDLAISRLRRKLFPYGVDLIETVRGGGYRFKAPVRQA